MFTRTFRWLAAGSVCLPLVAQAHVSIQSGPVTAALTQVVTFGVGHGCESESGNLDTTSVTVEIPPGVTSVRPDPSGFDRVSVETDKTGAVVSVTWSKDQALPDDIAYYQLKLRLKAPEAFRVLQFPAHQTCRSPEGDTELVVDWIGEEGDPDIEPAPVLIVLPERLPGWNKFEVDVQIDELETFFFDAQIVWQGNAAYSRNPATSDQIESTEGVATLGYIKADEEFWVKY